MLSNGVQNPAFSLQDSGLTPKNKVHRNLTPSELTNQTIQRGHGVLSDTGALVVATGRFTGRAPQDRYMVKDALTGSSVNWGSVNIPFEPEGFDALHRKVAAYLDERELFVTDGFACADPRYRLGVRVISELPWQSLFAWNMFIRPTQDELAAFKPDWHVIAAPGFTANPESDGTRRENFAIINFTKRIILIGGTGYTGEIKKGIFSVLNFLMPTTQGVLPMHCSANIGDDGDTALFFGLSGTGKTTLSADPHRKLIGDDEHGWSNEGIFNFEGGCYAKCINLSAENEPQIFNAIRAGALLENVGFFPGTTTVNFADTSITENTRVSYPLHFIDNAVEPSLGPSPQSIFFLSCDAFGVLPPISKLTPEQAMYYFLSGYTAKVAGTEDGVTDPEATFSTCFGAPFLPLHPSRYAEMLGQKMRDHNVRVWLVNTGWTGGGFGTGKRISLTYTRALISAALIGALNNVQYGEDPIFGLYTPMSCPGVPAEVLNPVSSWADVEAYDAAAMTLARKFADNFEKYAGSVLPEVLAAGPKVAARV